VSVSKGELRSAAIHEVGCKLDDVLDSAKSDVYRFDGAHDALLLVSSRMSSLYGDVKSKTGPDFSLEEAKVAKEYITRCITFLTKAADDASRGRFRAEGKVLGLEQSVKVAKSLYDVEKAKPSPSAKAKAKPVPLAVKRKAAKVYK